jgi:uncharacterized protein YjbI with pentapeptide repeats
MRRALLIPLAAALLAAASAPATAQALGVYDKASSPKDCVLCDMRYLSFVGAEMDGAVFRGSYLFNVNFARARLAGTDFESAVLVLAKFDRADLSKSNLAKANLSRAAMFGATLRDATLTFADLQGAYLEAAELTFADLTAANLRGARLPRAFADQAQLRSGPGPTGPMPICAARTCRARISAIQTCWAPI